MQWGLDEAALRRLILCVVEAEARTVHYLGLILADHETVLDLNRAYLAHDYLTDVLSFPLRENGYLGEVVISAPTARRQARRYRHRVEEEVKLLLLHGVLHLLGYDHETDRGQMARREHTLRRRLGLE
ncbi:MAG: rRNA maturation RNase YbeY [Acidobacteria bacterium]|nr:rRNA maturation RNase YbeY [Acidobacteriota bacterium]